VKLDLSKKDSQPAQLLLLTGCNKKVLEVGPATGYITEALNNRGCRVTAIEKDTAVAEITAKLCERMIIGDVEQIDFAADFAGEEFDVVIFGEVLEHLVDPQSVLAQAACILQPKGYVVASVPNIAHGSIRLALLGGEFRYTELGLLDRTHLRFFTRTSLEDLFREAGYSIRVWRRIIVDPFATELQLSETDYPARLVASLREDPESITYQFVVKAYPAVRRTRKRSSDSQRENNRPIAEPLKAIWQLEKGIAQRDAALTDKDRHIANIEAALTRTEEHLSLVQQQLQVATGTVGYRMLERTRRVIRWLFPPSSWRGIPYRTLIRPIRWLVKRR
jgi:2-polyprenyl-3-methyl-5-hydroxy-6-metoxy-1,4-benzoquinol methylase